jgi:DNA polymerase III subunit beta
MKFSAERESILAPLQAVIGVVERRQTMPILANVLISGRGEQLSITATDLEVELVAKANVTLQTPGEITLPGRKLLDIIKALPDKAQLTISISRSSTDLTAATTRSGTNSKYRIKSLAGADSPNRSMPTTTPRRPTYLRQMSGTPASTATHGNSIGRTCWR